MKRFVPLVFLTIGYVAGHTFWPAGPLAARSLAQTGQVGGQQQVALKNPTKAVYWSVETIRKAHAAMVGRSASGQAGDGGVFVPVINPTDAIEIRHRRHNDKPVERGGKMTLFDEAEMHTDYSELYVIVGGSGRLLVDGQIDDKVPMPPLPGDFRGPTISNGTSYAVREGDMLLIPPNTPHQSQPDPGGYSYVRIRVFKH